MASATMGQFAVTADSGQYTQMLMTPTATIDANVTDVTKPLYELNSVTIDLLQRIHINLQQSSATLTTFTASNASTATAVPSLSTLADVATDAANFFNESDNSRYQHAHVVNATHQFASSTWQRTCLLMFFTSIIFITIFGNTLVILSVITTRRLRTVTNCFVMSLAVADWMVGIFVMPPAVLLFWFGKCESIYML